MHRPREVIRVKEKIQVRLNMSDCDMEGYIWVGGQERVLDLFNGAGTFVPIEIDGRVRIINKNAIAWILPADGERMETSGLPARSVEDHLAIGLT